MVGIEKKIVISGAAGTGKSTLIEALEEIGFPCMEEVSRFVIDEQLQMKGHALPWKDVKAFSERCILETNNRLKLEEDFAFCDRGLLDYYIHSLVRDDQTIPKIPVDKCHEIYHSIVFYCPLWESIYEQEPQRPESFEHQVFVDSISRKIYEGAGFELVEVPKVSVEERCLFVEEELEIRGISVAI
ncbi:MAG: AAA family ATPase [Crocinitomicaceae bacterium]|nr:AAA family ATPase [Crocinitomicaceae bacterium]